MDSFYSETELAYLGLKSYGENVYVSRKCSIYSPEKIVLGNNVRIDDFCILSGNIVLGSFIHISAYSALYGSLGIRIDDYSGLSPRCTLFSASDDFSGEYMVGPMIDKNFTNITGGPIQIKRFVQIGAGCTILPNLIIEEGVAVGAMSLIKYSLKSWGIYKGIPVRFYKPRSQKILNFINA